MSNPVPIQVLIVEDVDPMRSLLEHVVGGIPGFGVSGSARNGFEARLELTRRRPDLVLLDEILPGESSGDLLKELQKDGIPVLLLTGVADPTHAVPKGAQGRLSKPGWKTADQDRKRLEAEMRRALQKSG